MSEHATAWLKVLIAGVIAGAIYVQTVHVWNASAYAGLVATIAISIRASLTQTPADAKDAAGDGTLWAPGVSMAPYRWTAAEGGGSPPADGANIAATTVSTYTDTGSSSSTPTS